MREELGIFALLVVLCIVVAILNPRFLAGANLQNMARLIGMYGIFSIGIGMVIITGGIDLSVGSVFALLGVLLSIMLTEWHLPGALAVVAVIAVGAGLGLLHGFLVTRVLIPPFISLNDSKVSVTVSTAMRLEFKTSLPSNTFCLEISL